MTIYYKHIVLTLSLLLSLSGCSVVQVVVTYDPEVQRLRDGEHEFELGNYSAAEGVFLEIYESETNLQIKNTALYNLACTNIMLAQDGEDLIEAVAMLDRWKEAKQRLIYVENPNLTIAALRKHAAYIHKEAKKFEQSRQKSQAIINEKNKQLEILKHQISELEAIDQQLQEKKKPL